MRRQHWPHGLWGPPPPRKRRQLRNCAEWYLEVRITSLDSQSSSLPSTHFPTFPKADYDLLVYSFTEVAMILICSSLPLLPKFLQLIIPTTTHSKRTSSPSVYQQNLRDHYAKPYNSQSTKNKSKTLPSLPVSSFSHTGIDTHREGSEDSYLPLTNKERGGVGVKVCGGWDKDVDVDV